MSRQARDRRENHPKPVEKIELDARHTKVRLALAIVLLLGGVLLILYALTGGFSEKSGWTEIEAASGKADCSGDFTFLYPLGTSASPRSERRALTALYEDACRDAYRLFSNDEELTAGEEETAGEEKEQGSDTALDLGRESSAGEEDREDLETHSADGAAAGLADSPGAKKARQKTLSALDAGRIEAYAADTNEAGATHNVRYLNVHPNEEIEVEAPLYEAFSKIEASGDRSLYLAPVYEIYDGVFYCDDPVRTADFDPRQNDALRGWFAKVCAFALDPAQVNLELLGHSRVRLSVSDEYLSFAKEEEIESFIDFYWMKNAFIADYLAKRLIEGGFTVGTLSSFDGFSRSLDTGSATEYSLNLYDGSDGVIRTPGVLHYQGAQSIVCLRSYPLNESANRYYAEVPDGSICTPYLDTADGLCKSAVNDLTAYSESLGCADILLKLIPVYIAEEFDSQALFSLSKDGIQSIYFENGKAICTDDAARIEEETN